MNRAERVARGLSETQRYVLTTTNSGGYACTGLPRTLEALCMKGLLSGRGGTSTAGPYLLTSLGEEVRGLL
jgi:hypothetical protein